MRNLRKFNTESEYNSATLNYPAVSWVVSGDIVHFDKETPVPPTPSFSGLTVYYNITDISQPTQLFKGGGSGSGSGSDSGGALPSAMIIDGTAVEVTNTYQFSTTGEHIVQYSIENDFKEIPNNFLSNITTVIKVIIGDYFEKIGNAFQSCSGLTSVTIPSGVTSIGNVAFNQCTSLTSITSNVATAPSITENTFRNVSANGVLTVPSGSQGYCDWIGKLPSWTIEGVTCGSGSGSGS